MGDVASTGIHHRQDGPSKITPASVFVPVYVFVFVSVIGVRVCS
jgi:hypothetical protein